MSEVVTAQPDYFRYFRALPFQSTVSIGGVSLNLWSDDLSAIQLSPQLAPFAAQSCADVVDFHIKRVDHLASSEAPCSFNSGAIWKLYDNRAGDLTFDFESPVFGQVPYKRLSIDPDFTAGEVLLNDAVLPEQSALEYPLDEIVVTSRLSLAGGAEIHACGVALDSGKGILLAGHSGAGKSTSARLWQAAAGAKILSDDRVILRRDLHAIRMFGTPWHGEADFALAQSAQLSRIYVLEHGLKNELHELSQSAAAAELFARSFVPFYNAAAIGRVLEFLQRVTAKVPCFRFAFVPDATAVEMLVRHVS